MRASNLIGICAVVAAGTGLAAQGLARDVAEKRASSSRALSAGGDIQPLPPCATGTPTDIKYTVDVTLPKHLHFNKASLVKRVKIRPSPYLDGSHDNKSNDSNKNLQPFHIFLNDKIMDLKAGYVKVNITKSSDSTYYLGVYRKSGDLVPSGVAGISSSQFNVLHQVLCSISYKGPTHNAKRKEEKIEFYIDIKALSDSTVPKTSGDSIPFNIWVIPEDFEQTPIIIDPAVRNEG